MTSPEKSFDLVVLGSGPGGYVAAIRAAQLGLTTALVEKDAKFGGTCLHVGCIPTKCLLHDARLYKEFQRASKHGIRAKEIELDFGGVQGHKERVVKKLALGVQGLLKKNKVSTFHGFGKIRKPGEVEVSGETIRAKSILIATGSSAQTFPGLEPDGKGILTNVEILSLREVPKSLLVVGAGAVGVEFASVFAQFGSEVTLVEMLPQLVPLEDREIAAELLRIFKKRRIAVHAGTKVGKVEPAGDGYRVELEAKEGKARHVEVEKVLVAVGRRPNTDGIGLENTKVRTERGYIRVGGHMETDEPGVYAIGDVVPTPLLAHVASAEGMLVAEKLAGRQVKPVNYDQVPNVTYSDPQIVSVGLTEREAGKRGHKARIGKFPFAGCGKASIEMESDGFVKIVADERYGEILGVHIIHAGAGELVGEATAVLRGEFTAEDLSHTVHAHPTLSEAILEASHAVYGNPIHI